MAEKLTVRFVEAVIPGAKDVIIWDSELRGLGLKVTPKGKKSFFLYYRTAGDHTQRKPRIGEFPDVRPEEARRIAREWKLEVIKGGDPSASKKARRANKGKGTVSELFEAYKRFKAVEEVRSLPEIERLFRHDIIPVIGSRRAEDITSHEITKLLDTITKRSPAVAWAVRRQLSAFYRWAVPRLPPGSTNPVASASRPPATKPRDRVLTELELRSLWQVLEGESDTWRTALRLLILTGQRREEVLAAHWPEFDLAAGVWTIPGARAKNGKQHIVPLSPEVMELLTSRPSRTGPLFPNGAGAVSKAAGRIRGKMNGVPHWRWHDIRRTVATGLQRLGVRWEVTEAVLNHVSGARGGIVGVYQQHDWANEKRHALELWAKEVSRIVRA